MKCPSFWLLFSRSFCLWLHCSRSCYRADPAGYFSLGKGEEHLHCLLSMLFLFGANCSGFWSIFELILGWLLMIRKAAFNFIHLVLPHEITWKCLRLCQLSPKKHTHKTTLWRRFCVHLCPQPKFHMPSFDSSKTEFQWFHPVKVNVSKK